MKKLLAFILTFCLLLNTLSVGAYLIDNKDDRVKQVKQLILSKNILKKTSKGRKYSKFIEIFIEKNKNNRKLLEKVSNKITPFLENESIKNSETLNIIKYMDAKINLALLELPIVVDNISKEDKEKVEDEIVSLQLNLFNKGTNHFDFLLSEFEKLSNYEDKGNFSLNFNAEQEKYGKIKSHFNFNNYSFKKSNFDSQLKGEIDALIDASTKGEDDFKIKLSGLIDFIGKDGNAYLLLEKLNITDEKGTQEIKSFLDEIKNIAKENKYIIYSDSNKTEALNILNGLSPSSIISQGKSILSKPLFEAYNKDGDKYLLKPTKYACDTFKQIANKFDPFNGSKCTDGQYEDMLEDLEEVGIMYIKIGNTNELGIYSKNDDIDFKGYIVYNNTNILELFTLIKSMQLDSNDEKFELKYKKSDKLSIYFNVDEGDISYNFESELDKNNKFTKIDFKGHTANKYSNYAINLSLRDKKIDGKIEINNNSYDWYTKEYEKFSTLNIDISGTTDYKNKLGTLKIDTTGIKLKDNSKYYTSDFRYKKGEIVFNSHTVGYLNTDFELTGKWDSDNKILTGLNLLFSVKEKQYGAEDNFNEVYKTELSLKNTKISGSTYIWDREDEVVKITHTGKYKKDYLKFNNYFELAKNPFDSIGGYSKDARNSKRTSDIGNIQSAMSLKQVEGVELPAFIILNDKYAGKDLYVGGEKLIYGENYFIGTPNYSVLNINKEDFLDPNGNEYIIAATLKAGGVFQILAEMEVDNNKQVRINGIYTTRYMKDKSSFISDGNIVILNNYFANFFKKGDITNLGKINKVSRDGITLTLNNNISSTEKDIYLIKDEPISLISIDGKMVKDKDIIGNIDNLEEGMKEPVITGNINIITDLREDSEYFKIYLDLKSDLDKIIEFDIINNSKRTYREFEIKTPTNTIEFDKVLTY